MLLFSGLKFWNYYLLISLNPVEKTKKLVKSRVHFLLEWIIDTLLTTEVQLFAAFRDGVSESQFTQVINIELDQIIEVIHLF